MDKNSDILNVIGAVGIAVGIGILLIYVSRDRDIILQRIRTTMKVMFVLALLLLAFLIYPAGIMGTPLASLTLGELGRFLISGIFVLSFIAVIFLMIRRRYY